MSRRFGEVEALCRVNLRVGQGEYLAITGPSGSGKSTILHLLGLLDRPTTGIYRFEGQDVSAMGDIERSALRGRSIGFVFQAFHLVRTRTAVENVEMAMLYRPSTRRERRRRAWEALDDVGLLDRVHSLPTTLSGGERQRVAIARAVAAGAKLLLADEPTGNLDTETGRRILDLFQHLHSSGMTLVVITHDADIAARAERVCQIRDGVLKPGSGSTAEVG